MTNNFIKWVTSFIGVLIFLFWVNPAMYGLMNPIGFWQNFVMLCTVDLTAFVLTVGGISEFINSLVD